MSLHEPDDRMYYDEQAKMEIMYEGIEEEIYDMSEHELIEYITDHSKLEEEFRVFIIADLNYQYKDVFPSFNNTGSAPDLLIDLLEPDNYLTYYRALDEHKQKKVKEMVVEYKFDKDWHNQE